MKTGSSLLLATAIAAVLVPQARSLAQGLEEIVVTAQRREQSLQDVPISVTAMTGEAITEGGFSDMEDISAFVPNLTMTDGLTGQTLIVRGIGTSTGNEAFEQAVAQFHDGIYYGRDNLGQGAFFDIARIEVVRGPQPTFAGQSATAGAINVLTRGPERTWNGDVTAAYGNDDEMSVEGAAGGPLSDTFGIRVAGRYYELGDTGYTSIIGNIPQGVKRNTGGRLTALWTPTDNFDFTFKYEYQDVWQRGTGGEYTRCDTRPQFSRGHASITPGIAAPCALDAVVNGSNLNSLDGKRGTGGTLDIRATIDALNAASGAAPGSANYWGHYGPDPTGAPGRTRGLESVAYGLNTVREFNEPEVREFQADSFLGAFNWGIGNLTLSSNTSFVQYDKSDWLDPDYSSFAVYTDERIEDFEQKGQEFRLSSASDQTVSWMIGGYWQKHELHSTINVYLPTLLNTGSYAPAGSRAASFGGTLTEDSEWLSGFFAATWNIADTFRMNLGGRYQDVSKEGVLPPTVSFLGATATEFGARQAIPGRNPARGRIDDSDFLPEVGFEFDATDNVMTYARYAKAFKAGGFVMSPPIGGDLPNPFTFEPEYAEGYEVGLKGRFFDNRLEFNSAVYYTEYTNLQVTLFNSSTSAFVTSNAGKAHTQGLEFDTRWAVTDAFTVGFNGALAAEAKYDSFPGAQCNSLQGKQSSPCTQDLSGVDLNYSPEWQFGISPEYAWSLGNFSLTAGANLKFSDGYTTGAQVTRDPIDEISSYERLDVRFGFAPMEGDWEVSIYGRDVTDQRLKLFGQGDFPNKSADRGSYDAGGVTAERGARYGAQVTFGFGN